MLKFPIEPKALLHAHGGDILKITGIGHTNGKAEDGQSRDYWYFVGDCKWHDGSGTSTEFEIMPFSVAYQNKVGSDEFITLNDALVRYLNRFGKWFENGPHSGWYANDRKLAKRVVTEI